VGAGSAKSDSASGVFVPEVRSADSQTQIKRLPKFQLGYFVNDNFALEAGYVGLAKAKDSSNLLTTGAALISSIDGWRVSGLGVYPLNDVFAVYGRVGLVNAKFKASSEAFSNTNSSASLNTGIFSTTLTPNLGLGVKLNLSPNSGLRAEYEQFQRMGDQATGRATVDLFSLGFGYRF
jgi:opacity protein-like surface antigen